MTETNPIDLASALSPELFRKIKAIQIRTQRLVTDVLAGEYESAFKGRGMEFEAVREYQPGDDVRHIDWNVTARTGYPHVKVHREERELTVMLLVDVSSSGAFGSTDKLKNEIAAEVAAVLAYAAIRSNDRVGLIIFTDGIERYIPPKKGRAHVWRVIREILTFRPTRRATDLEGALEFLGKVTRRRAVVFVISDFLDEGYGDRLRIGARRHDMTAVSVTDPREIELPSIGLIELEDAETGEMILVDTRDQNVTDGFRVLGSDERIDRSNLFRGADVGEIRIRTDEATIEPIIRFFRAKEHRR
ncbi:MAG: DUF58 domain-containing protein [Myxococcota bacterium]